MISLILSQSLWVQQSILWIFVVCLSFQNYLILTHHGSLYYAAECCRQPSVLPRSSGSLFGCVGWKVYVRISWVSDSPHAQGWDLTGVHHGSVLAHLLRSPAMGLRKMIYYGVLFLYSLRCNRNDQVKDREALLHSLALTKLLIHDGFDFPSTLCLNILWDIISKNSCKLYIFLSSISSISPPLFKIYICSYLVYVLRHLLFQRKDRTSSGKWSFVEICLLITSTSLFSDKAICLGEKRN